jgi:hypothetical protein
MRQWWTLKTEYYDTILFFKVIISTSYSQYIMIIIFFIL